MECTFISYVKLNIMILGMPPQVILLIYLSNLGAVFQFWHIYLPDVRADISISPLGLRLLLVKCQALGSGERRLMHIYFAFARWLRAYQQKFSASKAIFLF